LKYEVKQNGKKWEIVRIKDGIAIDSWDKKHLAERRLEFLSAMGWNVEKEKG